MITNFFYPETKNENWLKNKSIIYLIVITLLFSLLFYLFVSFKSSFIYFIIFYILIIILILFSKISTNSTNIIKSTYNVKSIYSGIAIAGMIILSYYLTKLNIIAYFVYLAISIIISGLLLRNNFEDPKIILVAIGSYSIYSLFNLIIMLSIGFIPGILSSIIFLIIFILSIFKIKKMNLR